MSQPRVSPRKITVLVESVVITADDVQEAEPARVEIHGMSGWRAFVDGGFDGLMEQVTQATEAAKAKP